MPGAGRGGYRFASTCNCDFYKSAYPYGIGPRIGVAYQLTRKTVLRGGWGINYQFIANPAGGLVGLQRHLSALGHQSLRQHLRPPGPSSSPLGRPPTRPSIRLPAPLALRGRRRWSPTERKSPASHQPIQRQHPAADHAEFLDRGVLCGQSCGLARRPLGELSQVSAQTYATYGLYPYPGTGPCSTGGGVCSSSTYNNYNDRALLTQPINSTQVISAMASRGFPHFLPYSGFPVTNSLQSALYAYPQFGKPWSYRFADGKHQVRFAASQGDQAPSRTVSRPAAISHGDKDSHVPAGRTSSTQPARFGSYRTSRRAS